MPAQLLRFTSPRLMLCRIEVPDRAAVITALAERLAAVDPQVDAEQVARVAVGREEIESTAIGDGVALPHARTDGVPSARLCVASLASPVDWDSWDGAPVDLAFLILGSRRAPAQQLRMLGDVSGLLRQEGFCEALRDATDPVRMYAALRSASTRQG